MTTNGAWIMELLVSPVCTVVMVLAFLVALVLLVWKGRTLRPAQRAVLLAVLAVSVLYLLFFLWLVVGFGRGPLREPTL